MTTELPVPVAAWLTGPGLGHVDRATAELDDGADELNVGTTLRRELTPDRAAAVMGAAVGRGRARAAGVPNADALLLTRTSLEQASRPAVSSHRAERFAGAGTVIDLCAGAGIDAVAISRVAGVVAVERDVARALLLRHNSAASGGDVSVVAGDAARPPVAVSGFVHADPSRRHGGHRARALGDYGPPVPDLLSATAGADGVGIVVSPAVAWDDPALPPDAEVEFIQVGPDLVEAVLWLGDLRRPGARATATLLHAGASRSVAAVPRPTETTGALAVGDVGAWLVEVSPAAVRARLHDVLGAEIGARRIARNRALLTVDTDPGPSPWWRTWQVEAVLPARPRAVRAWLRDAPTLPLEIATHGLDAAPTTWWRGLGSPLRGPDGRRLHLVRTDDGAACIVARSR